MSRVPAFAPVAVTMTLVTIALGIPIDADKPSPPALIAGIAILLGLLHGSAGGQLSAIGIVKGKEFNPDARMRKILTDAAAVGNAAGRVLNWRPNESLGWSYYPGSSWTNKRDRCRHGRAARNSKRKRIY